MTRPIIHPNWGRAPDGITDGKALASGIAAEMAMPCPWPLTTLVRVRELPLLADIGINPDEIGCRQPLVISVELEVEAGHDGTIEQTVDYRRIASAAEELALVHIPLIETFGRMLAERCLAMARVISAKVEIQKPFALKRGQAGIEVVMRKA